MRADRGESGGEHRALDLGLRESSGLQFGARYVNDRANDGDQPGGRDVASEDAFFQDPVVLMGIPGVEYFAHAFEMNPRQAKEFLMLGERMSARRAYEVGMVNRVVERDRLEEEAASIAAKLAERGRLALALTKQAINHVDELRGKRTAMDAVFHMHHFAHAHSTIMSGHATGGLDAKKMAAANKKQAGED